MKDILDTIVHTTHEVVLSKNCFSETSCAINGFGLNVAETWLKEKGLFGKVQHPTCYHMDNMPYVEYALKDGTGCILFRPIDLEKTE